MNKNQNTSKRKTDCNAGLSFPRHLCSCGKWSQLDFFPPNPFVQIPKKVTWNTFHVFTPTAVVGARWQQQQQQQ
jgi:hypothetical protein